MNKRQASRSRPRTDASRAAKPAAARAVSAVAPAASSLAEASVHLYGEWARTALGLGKREVPLKDPRFADPSWREHPLYRGVGQAYFTFCDAVESLAEHPRDWRKRERARFLGGVLTSTLAPTNTLMGNPAAMKRVLETGGMSLIAGAKNLIGDLLNNRGMPRQVQDSAFRVGENLATTAGAVVFRNEMVELLQYRPTTSRVTARPTLVIAPPIGKYYFLDLAPKRSFVEYAVSRGIPVFVTSWRNPSPEHGQWGLDDYVRTLLELVDAVCEITGSDRLNTLGMCGGGILTTLMLCVMAERGDERVSGAAFGVMLLDFDAEAPIGTFNSGPILALSGKRSAAKGVLPASSLASMFAWMRPNDLVWNYWVNNYLLGKEPPSFDILAWSVDGTNLPARLHGEFLEIFGKNLLGKAGALKVLGVPIDLKKVRVDTFAAGALSDHLTPWKACYKSIQLLGGGKTFVLSNSGHIASIVNPPGNPKAHYWSRRSVIADPDAWLAKATQTTGTWWEPWADWNLARSGRLRAAPATLGSARHPATIPAPGSYVLQKP